jgi:hypothetical protein
VSSSGRSPPSRGSSIVGAPLVGKPQDIVEAHNPKGSTVRAASGDGVPVSSATIAVGAVVLEVVTDDGSLAPEVSPEGGTNATVGGTVTGDPAASTAPTGGASPSTAVADDDDIVEESGVIVGHSIWALGYVSLDEGHYPLGTYSGTGRAPLGECRHQ